MDFFGPTPESLYPSFVNFIANPSLIKKYADDPAASPSLPKLVDLILRQNLESVNEPYSRLMRCHRVDLDDRTFRTASRIRASKTLTLMLASAVNWDLDKIEKDMSITMQFCLVQDLMNTVFSGTQYCSSVAEPVENLHDPSSIEARLKHNQSRLLSSFVPSILQTLDDHCIFGLLTYARWILRAHIQRKVPKRPAKGGIVSFGNITDPDVLEGLDQQSQGHSLIWTLFRQISREKVGQTSVDLLEYMVKLDKRSLRVPVPDSFVFPTNEAALVEENAWNKGTVVDFMEFRVEILYDLAGYWLYEGKIARSAELLNRVNILLHEVHPETFGYCHLDMVKFTKMCRICSVPPPTSLFPEPLMASNAPDLTPSMKGKLLDTLLEDLPLGRISSVSRTTLEVELIASDDASEKAFLQRVRICNLLRDFMSCQVAPSAMMLRGRLADATAVDLDWFRGILNGQRLPTDLRNAIVDKLKFLDEKNLLPPLIKTRLADVLSSKSSPDVVIKAEPEDVEMKFDPVEVGHAPAGDVVESLRCACTYAAVKTAIIHLTATPRSAGVKDFFPTWYSKIPPGLEISFGKSAWTPTMIDTVIVSFARAAEMGEEGCFRGAKQLLKNGRLDWYNYPKSDDKLDKKLDKNLRWQNMYLDLLESQQRLLVKVWTDEVKAEADRRAKICLKAVFFKTPDEEPVPAYVEDLAVLVLFNVDEWSFVKEVAQDQKRKSSSTATVFPFLKQLHAATVEFLQQKDDLTVQFEGGKSRLKAMNRQECLKLWNVLAAALSKTELPQSVFKKPAAPSAAVTISPDQLCLANRDNKSLPTIIDPLWPVTLPLNLNIGPSDINSALSKMIDITNLNGMNDADICLLKGDFYFYQLSYELAVEIYLRSFVAGTVPGFLHPGASFAPSQTVLRKLISCFESLRCHTYVAVLCQLVVTIDYDTAYRSLAEKVTYDASDDVYRFIWDPLILEHAAYTLQKYGFLEKRQVVMDLLQNPILNGANPPSVAQNVASEKANEFFEILFDQYVVR